MHSKICIGPVSYSNRVIFGLIGLKQKHKFFIFILGAFKFDILDFLREFIMIENHMSLVANYLLYLVW